MVELVLAHSGGFSWDEAAFVLLPVLVLLVLSRQARKRAAAQAEEEAGKTPGPPPVER